jgi:hypothetical protein
MSGQADWSLAESQWSDVYDVAGGIDGSTNEAIQTIEAYLGASNMSPRIRDAWKRI